MAITAYFYFWNKFKTHLNNARSIIKNAINFIALDLQVIMIGSPLASKFKVEEYLHIIFQLSL